MQQQLRGASASKYLVSAALACTAVSAHAIPISGQGTWETTLQARDFNNDGTTDAFYDTTLNVTWLADANVAETQGYRGEGGYPYRFGVQPNSSFIGSLDIYGVTGWRLPQVFDTSYAPASCAGRIQPGFGCSFKPDAGSSELASLFYTTLGNAQGSFANTGNFSNVQNGAYYFDGMYTGPRDSVWGAVQHFTNGTHSITVEAYSLYGWAVKDGDVMVSHAPEPETYALMLLGLAGVGAWVKRQKRQAGSAAA
jgi:PEP-CTERM motif-containing protein